MNDLRSQIEKKLDEAVGLPLYYCAACKRAVKVTPIEGSEPRIERPCTDCKTSQIIAPRRAIAAGEGGLNFSDSVKMTCWKIAAKLTGRCV